MNKDEAAAPEDDGHDSNNEPNDTTTPAGSTTGQESVKSNSDLGPTVKSEALLYIARGIYVLPIYGIDPATGLCQCPAATYPCRSAGKHPLSSHAYHGSNDATLDPARVALWPDDCNLGIKPTSTLVCLDFDDPGIVPPLLDLIDTDPPGTYVAAQTRRGVHIWVNAEVPLEKTVVLRSSDDIKLADVKATGFLVVAPSTYAPYMGRPIGNYRWLGDGLSTTPAPKVRGTGVDYAETLVARLGVKLAKSQKGARWSRASKPVPDLPGSIKAIRLEDLLDLDDLRFVWAEGNLQRLNSGTMPISERSDTLFWFACEVWRAADRRGLTLEPAQMAGVVKELDVRSGWRKYADRSDADKYYWTTAVNARNRVDEDAAEAAQAAAAGSSPAGDGEPEEPGDAAEPGDSGDGPGDGAGGSGSGAGGSGSGRARPGGPPPGRGPTLRTVRADTITPKAVRWLWKGRVARAKLNISGGLAGLGKSTVKLDLIARITRGDLMPDGSPCTGKPETAIIFSAEDAAADTLVPRLIAAGADLTRVHIEQGVVEASGLVGRFNLKDHAALLEARIREVGAVYAVLDPLSAYVGAIDTHKDSESRQLLAVVADIAERRDCAVEGLLHLNKAQGLPALARLLGAGAFGNAARAVTMTMEDPDRPGVYAFGGIKVNNTAGYAAWAYVIEPVFLDGHEEVPPAEVAPTADGGYVRMRLEGRELVFGNELIDTSRVRWLGASTVNVAEAIASAGTHSGGRRLAQAVEFLKEVLADGMEHLQTDVESEAGERSISPSTLRKAKEDAGVHWRKMKVKEDPKQRWVWWIPLPTPHQP